MRTSRDSSDPAVVLFGETRRRILGWLLTHPDEALYVRQIIRQTGSAPGAVQRELALLTRAGLLTRTVQGRQVYYQADRQSSIYPELYSLFVKTSAIADILREALAPLAGRIRLAFVFGSASSGELHRTSDLDLLIVGDPPFIELSGALAPTQERLGREVNPTLYSPAEFRAKIRERHHFLTSVLEGPMLFVIGGPDELERLGTGRLADSPQVQPGGDSRPARRLQARQRRQRR